MNAFPPLSQGLSPAPHFKFHLECDVSLETTSERNRSVWLEEEKQQTWQGEFSPQFSKSLVCENDHVCTHIQERKKGEQVCRTTNRNKC